MDLLALIRDPQIGKRLAEILAVLTRYGLADKLRHIPLQPLRRLIVGEPALEVAELPFAERLRLSFQELGTTFIKLGQVLSTRADLVGPEIAGELARLQSGAEPDPPATVLATIREELGADAHELFASFEETAFSAASIGQVHAAKLHDGHTVVVKVQRSGIETVIRHDLDILAGLAALAEEYLADLRPYRPRALAREFRRTILKEIDFTWERRHLEQFAANFADDETVRFPWVHAATSSRLVLTMERLEGIPGGEADRLAASGLDLDRIARNAADVYMRMVFRDGFYHADPHPGNVMIMADGCIGLIDAGMCGRIDSSLHEVLSDFVLLLTDQDSDGLADLILRVGHAPGDLDHSAFRSDLSDLLMDYTQQEVDQVDVGAAFRQFNDILHDHRVQLPSSVAVLLKTLAILQGTGKAFSPHFSLLEVITPYRGQLLRERLDPRRLGKRLFRSAQGLDRLLRHGPQYLLDALEHLQRGSLRINHDIPSLAVTVNRVVSGILIAAWFLGSCLLLAAGRHWSLDLLGGLGALAALPAGAFLLWKIWRGRD